MCKFSIIVIPYHLSCAKPSLFLMLLSPKILCIYELELIKKLKKKDKKRERERRMTIIKENISFSLYPHFPFITFLSSFHHPSIVYFITHGHHFGSIAIRGGIHILFKSFFLQLITL